MLTVSAVNSKPSDANCMKMNNANLWWLLKLWNALTQKMHKNLLTVELNLAQCLNWAVFVSLQRRKHQLFCVLTVFVCSSKFSISNALHSVSLMYFQISTLEKSLEFSHMTSVQQRAIPYILNGRDTMVKSQTGSGKYYHLHSLPTSQKQLYNW